MLAPIVKSPFMSAFTATERSPLIAVSSFTSLPNVEPPLTEKLPATVALSLNVAIPVTPNVVPTVAAPDSVAVKTCE